MVGVARARDGRRQGGFFSRVALSALGRSDRKKAGLLSGRPETSPIGTLPRSATPTWTVSSSARRPRRGRLPASGAQRSRFCPAGRLLESRGDPPEQCGSYDEALALFMRKVDVS